MVTMLNPRGQKNFFFSDMKNWQGMTDIISISWIFFFKPRDLVTAHIPQESPWNSLSFVYGHWAKSEGSKKFFFPDMKNWQGMTDIISISCKTFFKPRDLVSTHIPQESPWNFLSFVYCHYAKSEGSKKNFFPDMKNWQGSVGGQISISY